MTNGEKIKEIFPNIKARLDAKTGIMIVKWADNTTKFFKTSWWNAEYKEPSSSEKPNKSENLTSSTNTISFKEMTDNLKITADDIENAEDLEYSIEPLVHPKNDLGVDCISRQELLKIYEDRFSELQKMKHLKDNKGAEDRQMGVNYCINILKELPSVTPILEQEPRWIPVSERLPERSGEYLVSVIDGSGDDIDYEAVRVAWLAHKKDYDIKESEWRELGIDEIVIAWMPLPKPYSEVEE